MNRPIRIQVRLESEQLRARCASALTAELYELTDGPAEVVLVGPNGGGADGVVGDVEQRRDADNDCGVVLIGEADDDSADARLPVNFLERELRMAVELVGELVRLRRAHRRAHRDRRQYEQLSLTDALTGIANRRAWDEEMSRLGADSERADGEVVLAVFDVDRFKSLNDRLGHAFGDDVLRKVATELAGNVRGPDLVARLGGDEFALLLIGPPAESARGVVERIRQNTVAALRRQFQADAPTLSVGFAAATGSAKAGLVFETADAALREAKRLGRDRTEP